MIACGSRAAAAIRRPRPVGVRPRGSVVLAKCTCPLIIGVGSRKSTPASCCQRMEVEWFPLTRPKNVRSIWMRVRPQRDSGEIALERQRGCSHRRRVRQHAWAMAGQRRGVRRDLPTVRFPAACGLSLTGPRGCVPQAGARDGQRCLNAPISAFSDAGAFDTSAIADARLGRGDTDRPDLERFAVAEAHRAPLAFCRAPCRQRRSRARAACDPGRFREEVRRDHILSPAHAADYIPLT
jgi:hypothetical protein